MGYDSDERTHWLKLYLVIKDLPNSEAVKSHTKAGFIYVHKFSQNFIHFLVAR